MSSVFHYAPWAYLPAMVQAGQLVPSNSGASNEKPMLWFSANQQWEPTAGKASGQIAMMTFKQQLAVGGCIRFGLPATDSRLMSWKAACTVAGTGRDERRAMERAGKKRGADPSQWFAIAESVPLDQLLLEVFVDNAWHPADPGEMAQIWTERRSTAT